MIWRVLLHRCADLTVTLVLTTAPKLSGFALAMRLLVDGLAGLSADWQQMLVVMAVLSMGTGNIVAMAQSNIKRMLASSTIATRRAWTSSGSRTRASRSPRIFRPRT